MLHLTKIEPKYEIYHLYNGDKCNWDDFAKEIFKEEEGEVTPVISEEFPQE